MAASRRPKNDRVAAKDSSPSGAGPDMDSVVDPVRNPEYEISEFALDLLERAASTVVANNGASIEQDSVYRERSSEVDRRDSALVGSVLDLMTTLPPVDSLAAFYENIADWRLEDDLPFRIAYELLASATSSKLARRFTRAEWTISEAQLHGLIQLHRSETANLIAVRSGEDEAESTRAYK